MAAIEKASATACESSGLAHHAGGPTQRVEPTLNQITTPAQDAPTGHMKSAWRAEPINVKMLTPEMAEVTMLDIQLLEARQCSNAMLLSQQWRAPPLYVCDSPTEDQASAQAASAPTGDFASEPAVAGLDEGDAEGPEGEGSSRKGKRARRRFKEVLDELDRLPAGTVIRVSRVEKLGPDYLEIIRQHFSSFGAIKDVLPVATQAKAGQSSQFSGIAFLAMWDRFEAHSITRHEEHDIGGVSVAVRMYMPNEKKAPRAAVKVEKKAPRLMPATMPATRPMRPVPAAVPRPVPGAVTRAPQVPAAQVMSMVMQAPVTPALPRPVSCAYRQVFRL